MLSSFMTVFTQPSSSSASSPPPLCSHSPPHLHHPRLPHCVHRGGLCPKAKQPPGMLLATLRNGAGWFQVIAFPVTLGGLHAEGSHTLWITFFDHMRPVYKTETLEQHFRGCSLFSQHRDLENRHLPRFFSSRAEASRRPSLHCLSS